MTKRFDLGVVIGRFQPPHLGHLHLIDKALELSKYVLIIIGSPNLARSCKNPFTIGERTAMLVEFLGERDNVFMTSVSDFLADVKWVRQVNLIIGHYATQICASKIGIIGCDKDGSSYYLKSFPNREVVCIEQHGNYHSTQIRKGLFMGILNPVVFPYELLDYIESHVYGSAWFKELTEEFAWLENYKKSIAEEYPPTFCTADVIAHNSEGSHVVLVTRKNHPGKGLLALPGGFVHPEETTIFAALRELQEETGIIKRDGDLCDSSWIETPGRDQRARIITHVFSFIVYDHEIEQLKAGDDAEKVHWYPVQLIKTNMENFYADHGLILAEHFFGL